MFLSQIGIYGMVFIVALLALRSPFIGLVGYYTLSFLRPQDIYWYSLGESRLSYYMAVVTIVSTLLHYSGRDKTVKRNNEFIWFFICFLVLALNSYLFSEDQETSYIYLLLLSKLLLMALVTVMVVENIRQVKILILMLVVCFGLLALRANYMYLHEGIWLAESPGQPGAGGRLDNNGFAMEFVMAIPMAFFMFFTEFKSLLLRWSSVSLIPFMMHTIILTYSRGGFIGMAVVLANCVLFLKHRKWAILAGVALFAVLMRLQGASSKERLQTISSYEQDPSIVSRFEAWNAGTAMMLKYKWSGVGIGNFEKYSQECNPNLPQPIAAHNAFLHIGGEMGLFALAAYIGVIVLAGIRLRFICRFYRSTLKTRPNYYYTTALRISLIGFVVCALFLSLNYLELFYFMIALCAALTNIYRRDLKGYENTTPV